MDAPGRHGGRRHVRRQSGRAGRGARRARRLRGRGPRRACRAHRRDDSRQDARMAGAPSADRRRPRPRRDARDRVRPGSARRRSPRPELATRVAEEAAQRGLLLLKAGTYSNCNRVLCPLVITRSGARRGAGRLGRRARSGSRVAVRGRPHVLSRGARRATPAPAARPMIGERDRRALRAARSSSARAACRPSTRRTTSCSSGTSRSKVLHPHYGDDEEYVERFRREARAVAQLSHPNIVTVIDRGEADGQQFIVFEYIDGENLEAARRAHRPAAGAARDRARRSQIADGARVRARARARAPRREAAERAR